LPRITNNVEAQNKPLIKRCGPNLTFNKAVLQQRQPPRKSKDINLDLKISDLSRQLNVNDEQLIIFIMKAVRYTYIIDASLQPVESTQVELSVVIRYSFRGYIENIYDNL
jgi:hypothetical protein